MREKAFIIREKEGAAVVDRYTCRGVSRSIGNCMTRNSSCGCNTNECSDNQEYKKILRKLQKVDFSLVDTVLYLDAYPCCKEALNYYHKLKKEREALVAILAEKYNMPISAYNNVSDCNWNWTDAPWPWEFSAN